MLLKNWVYPCLLIFACSCASIKPEKIRYNTSKQLFEYGRGDHAILLRNNKDQLIDSTNITAFQIELQNLKGRYPFNKRRENTDLLNNSDFKLAQLYAGINSAIQNKDFDNALKDISEMRQIYPAIDFYSDCSFLEGYTYEKLGQPEHAVAAYQKFNTYSSQKYSGLFRGHRDTDQNGFMYIAERNHAFSFLQQTPDSLNEAIIHSIESKYYYASNQPGFIINPEDVNKKIKHIEAVYLGLSQSDNLEFGFQISLLLSNRANLNAMVYLSEFMKGLGLSIPVQLYQSESNNLGIKIRPFFTSNSIKAPSHLNYFHSRFNYFNNNMLFNYGFNVSVARYFNQKLYIGAYYLYNRYNENNRYNSESMSIWFNNEFDLSTYYCITKGISLKVGVKNSDFVAGFYLGGMEISYDFTNPGLILRSDIF